MPTKEMPKIKELVTESWERLTASFGNIFLLSLMGSVLGIVLLFTSFITIAGVGFLSAFGTEIGNRTDMVDQLRSFLTPEHLTQMGLGFLVLTITSWVISSVVKLGIIYAVGKSKEKPSLGLCISSGFSFLIPTMVIGIVTSLIVFGSWFVLVIPAIVISLFFSFVSYEIILGGKKWFNAVTSSVQIISQHFGEVLIRMMLFVLGVWALYIPIYILKMIATSFGSSAPGESSILSLVVSLVQFIIGIVVSFYGIAYSVTTYQHAKALTSESIKPKITWIWVVSLIGWLIALLVGSQLIKVYMSPLIQDKIKSVMEQAKSSTTAQLTEQEKINSFQEAISTEARPYWDKSNDIFKQMHEAKDVVAIKKLNDQNITALVKATEINPDNPELWNSLGDAYTWVSTKGKPDDALNSYKKAEELSPELFKYQYAVGSILLGMEKYDEAILQLQKSIRTNDGIGRAHISLGVAYKRTGLKESAITELQKGIDILTKYNDKGEYDSEILTAKKELETVGQTAVKTSNGATNGKPVASCTSYPIREGEFASNKCYVKKDYDDLQYYLAQYNNAATSYNGAASSSNITCNGSDFFKSQCEKDKQTMTSAQAKLDGYKTTIRAIIARGK